MKINKFDIEKIFACPRCKNPLKPKKPEEKCSKCKFSYKKSRGIWNFLYIPQKKSQDAQKEYDQMHREKFARLNDGSYEVLASFARGNRTVDIACGDGYIEQLAPETVGVEFSLNALKKAQKNGAQYLILADAHDLPFQNNIFDLAICAGSIEHFKNPQKVIDEMARISRIQILTVHKELPFPFARFFFNLLTAIFNIKHQPIEKPINIKSLESMLAKAKLYVVFKGIWTIPLNFGHVISFLPEFKNIPSCSFIISIRNDFNK